jgi:hypothetical protein
MAPLTIHNQLSSEKIFESRTNLTFFLRSSLLFRMDTVKPSGKGGKLDPFLTAFSVLLIEGVNGIGIDGCSACMPTSSSVAPLPLSILIGTGPGGMEDVSAAPSG